jgi:hypothetical protein
VEFRRQKRLQAGSARIGLQQHLQAGLKVRQRIGKTCSHPKRRNTVASRLLARASKDSLPVCVLARYCFGIQTYRTAQGGHRHYCSDPQFGGFLQDHVHLLATRNALQQRYLQR